MIHVIIRYDDNTYPDIGRVVLIGSKEKYLHEYRILTKILADKYGTDSLVEAMLGCKFDNLSHISVEFKEEVTT